MYEDIVIDIDHPLNILQRFEHEITVWADLRNDNVLPFYGIVTDLGQHIHMVQRL